MGVSDPGKYKSGALQTLLYNGNAVSYRASYHDYFQGYGTRFRSAWVNLQKGEKYYTETWHSEGVGGDHHTVQVEIEKSNTEGHHHAMPEAQEIKMYGPTKFEKSRVRMINPDNGLYRLKITDPGNGNIWTSENIPANASSSTFHRYLRHYMNGHGSTFHVVTRSGTTESGEPYREYDMRGNYARSGVSYEEIEVQRVTTTATFEFTPPKDLQVSDPPITGKFRIRGTNSRG